MPWGAQSWLRLTQEATFGIRNPSPSASQVIWVRLYQDNPFGMRPVPARQIIRSADASNRRRQVVHGRTVYTGSLSTLLYPTQASYLMTAIQGLGTNVPNQLPSYTLDYFDSTRVQGYLGCTAQTATLTSNAQTDYVPVSLSWIGQQIDVNLTALTQPTDGNFPLEVPYEHVESAGNITVGGATLSKYSSLTTTINNVLVGTWDELPFISACYYCGRDVDFTARVQYLSTIFRQQFETQAPLVCSLKWNRLSGGHSLTVNCETTTYIGSIEDEIPLGGPAYQTIAFQVFYDPFSGSDISVTAA
jgi:hypothetical protein